jgi:peptidoglycan/xylan/chitin deacetylase (PgdA/CDA1 family)
VSELRVALTLDAEHPDRPWCPPGNADGILDTLKEREVTATFFVQGRWAEA